MDFLADSCWHCDVTHRLSLPMSKLPSMSGHSMFLESSVLGAPPVDTSPSFLLSSISDGAREPSIKASW